MCLKLEEMYIKPDKNKFEATRNVSETRRNVFEATRNLSIKA